MDKARGNERGIMARKWSFVWTYLEEDGHLRRYAQDSWLKHPGMSRRQQKMEDKRGSNNHGDGRGSSLTTTDLRGSLPSDPSPQRWRLISHRNTEADLS